MDKKNDKFVQEQAYVYDYYDYYVQPREDQVITTQDEEDSEEERGIIIIEIL